VLRLRQAAVAACSDGSNSAQVDHPDRHVAVAEGVVPVAELAIIVGSPGHNGAVVLERHAVVVAAGEGLYVRSVQTATDPDEPVAVDAKAADPVAELTAVIYSPHGGKLLDDGRRGSLDAYRRAASITAKPTTNTLALPTNIILLAALFSMPLTFPCARSLLGRRDWPAVPLHATSAAYTWMMGSVSPKWVIFGFPRRALRSLPHAPQPADKHVHEAHEEVYEGDDQVEQDPEYLHDYIRDVVE
jgi:hypothetical protein